MTDVRDIIFYSTKQIAYLKGVINNTLTPCVDEWRSGLTVSILHIEQNDDPDFELPSAASNVLVSALDSKMCVYAGLDAADAKALGSSLFGVDKGVKTSGFTSAMIEDLLLDVAKSLSPKLLQRGTDIDADKLAAAFDLTGKSTVGGGKISLTVQLGDARFKLFCNQQLVAFLLSGYISDNQPDISGEPLTKFSTLLTDRKVSLEVLIGSLELTVASLATLQVNDVIQLDKSIGETVTMKVLDTDVYCKGYPVQCEEKKALQLVS